MVLDIGRACRHPATLQIRECAHNHFARFPQLACQQVRTFQWPRTNRYIRALLEDIDHLIIGQYDIECDIRVQG